MWINSDIRQITKARGRLITLSFLLVVSFGLVIFIIRQAPGQAATVAPANNLSSLAARRSFDFTDSIGVNTHLTYPSYNQNYYQRNQATVVDDVNSLINDLGVKHIREAVNGVASWSINIGYGPITVSPYAQMKYLSGLGIKFNAVATGWHIINCSQLPSDTISQLTHAQCIYGLSPSDPSYAATQIVMPSDTTSSIVSAVTNMKAAGINIESLEGYNEYHTYIPSALAGKTWPQIYPANWEQVISLQTKNVTVPAAQTLGLPLVGPSFVPDFGGTNSGCVNWPNYSPPLFAPSPPTAACTTPPTTLDNLSAVTAYGNTHAYQSTYYSGPAGFLNGWKVTHWWDSVYGSLPKIFTEVGYQDSQFTPIVQEKYTSRILFELFNSGVKRTYFYELLDEIGTAPPSTNVFGLAGFNADGTLKIKPVYTALKNTMSILNDPSGTSFTPQNLNVSIVDPSNGNLHKTVLQNSIGDSFIVLWNEKTIPSTDTDSFINNVNLGFDQNTDVSVYRPSTSSGATQSASAVTAFSLNVPDDIIILKIKATPAAKANNVTGKTTTPASPANTAGKSVDNVAGAGATTAGQAGPVTAATDNQPLKVLNDTFFPNSGLGTSTKPLAYLFIFLLSSVVLVIMVVREFFRFRVHH